VTLTAWRGTRQRDAIAILLSASVIVPFLYFLWKSLTLRIGDTWPMFLWPIGFAAAAINITMLPREGWPAWMIKSTIAWANIAVASGIVLVVGTFLYSVASPWSFFGKADPIGGEAGYEQVASRAQAEMQAIGASWIATTDYRTYAMLRWYLNGRVPVVQINERGRFTGFRDPGMNSVRGRTGLYVAREPDQLNPVWASTTAVRVPLMRVERSWRGMVMDSYALEKLTGWTPDLTPPPDSPLYRWRVLAGDVRGGSYGGPRLAFGYAHKIRTLDKEWHDDRSNSPDSVVALRNGAAGVRRGLSRPRHQNGRAVRRRRRHRRAGADHRAKSQ
jgi:hypothetical protein